MITDYNEQQQEEFYFFWRGPFSQWHNSQFTINKTLYVNCEQFMMSEKAKLFGDVNIYSKIMDQEDPWQIKRLGREIKQFDQSVWEQHRFTIVLAGNIAKFSQNQDLQKELLNTGLKTMVEASPYDTIWGIGLAEDDPDCMDRDKWKGLNLLGQVLDMTREYIRVKNKFGLI